MFQNILKLNTAFTCVGVVMIAYGSYRLGADQTREVWVNESDRASARYREYTAWEVKQTTAQLTTRVTSAEAEAALWCKESEKWQYRNAKERDLTAAIQLVSAAVVDDDRQEIMLCLSNLQSALHNQGKVEQVALCKELIGRIQRNEVDYRMTAVITLLSKLK